MNYRAMSCRPRIAGRLDACRYGLDHLVNLPRNFPLQREFAPSSYRRSVALPPLSLEVQIDAGCF
jgi:hypothetical protein